MVSDWIKADCFENTECWYEDRWIRLLLFLLVWHMENRKEFRWTNRGCFESEYRDQFHIVICTYSYHQTDIWKSREQWYLTTSYFGIMDRFDLKLILEFDSSPTGPSVVEWFEKAERVCQLCKIKEPVLVIPLRLTKRAWKKSSRLCMRLLVQIPSSPGDSLPSDGLSQVRCAFPAGLPDNASRLLRASSRLNEHGLDKLLARARNILKDNTEPVSAAVEAPEQPREGPRCYRCGGPNHFSRDCRSQSSTKDTPDQRARKWIRCYKLGHIAQNCPGNRQGEEDAAPVSSQNRR